MNKRKKNRDKFNPGLSVNRPSNNSALKSKEQLLLLCFALCYFIAGAKQAIVKACGEGWGWPTWGGFAQKGYLFQASGTSKGQGFRSVWSVKRPRRAFYGCEKLRVKKKVLILRLIPILQSVHLQQRYHLSKEGIR